MGVYRGLQAFAMSPTARRAEPLFNSATILEGGVGGCVERRPDHRDWCDFDGRLSLVWWKKRFHLFARANTGVSKRFVQMATSPNLRQWSDWSLITLADYKPFGQCGPLPRSPCLAPFAHTFMSGLCHIKSPPHRDPCGQSA